MRTVTVCLALAACDKRAVDSGAPVRPTDSDVTPIDSADTAPPELCNGEDDDADPSTGEDGRASFVDAAGGWSDVTAWLDGTGDPSAALLLDAPGTLVLCPGAFTGRLRVEADVTVRGAGAGLTTLSAGFAGAAVEVAGPVTVLVEELSIADGVGVDGGGVACADGAALTVRAASVAASEAVRGGGLGAVGCDLVLERVDILGASAAEDGGGVAVIGGSLTASAVRIAGGVAGARGGALYVEAAAGWLADSVLTGGEAPRGGDLAIGPGGDVTCAGAGAVELGLAEAGGAAWLEDGARLEAQGCHFGDEADPINDNAPYDVQSARWTSSDYGADAVFTCDDAGCFPVDIAPMLIAPIVHIDPIPGDATAGPVVYGVHRDAVLWMRDALEAHGAGLSAFMTGPYAEAVVLSGHADDFAGFMPGGPHLLGMHMHSNWKAEGDGDWVWQAEPDKKVLTDVEHRLIYETQVHPVNQIFEALGVDPTMNRWIHGTTLDLEEEGVALFNIYEPRDMDFPNAFDRQIGLKRGGYHAVRADWRTREEGVDLRTLIDADDTVIRLPVQSGLLGYDEVHGEEGFVYGTVPMIQRQFVVEYLEWREIERGVAPGRGRQFVISWSLHPYQCHRTAIGTDGLNVRAQYEALLDWLDPWIASTTPRGTPVAQWGTTDVAAEAFEAWDDTHGEAEQGNIDADGHPVRWLAAILDPLEDYAFAGYLEAPPAGVTGVWLTAELGDTVLLAWSDGDPAALDIAGALAVHYADGTVDEEPPTSLEIGGEPVQIRFPNPDAEVPTP